MKLIREKIYFAKMYDDVKIPTKRDEDGGFDVYAHFEEKYMLLQPHETKMIPTGLVSAFDQTHLVLLKERGSTGSKGIGQRCGVIDSGYRGEWFVALTNHNDKPLLITKETNESSLEALADDYIVYPYSKAICQAVVIDLPTVRSQEVSIDEIASIGSERSNGVLGSSGK